MGANVSLITVSAVCAARVTHMLHVERKSKGKACVILQTAVASGDGYIACRRCCEGVCFIITLAFMTVYMLKHTAFSEVADRTVAVEIVKWWWLFAANSYLWFVLLSEHIFPDLLPLQPLAMVLIMAGYFVYAALVSVDIPFYWELGVASRVWVVLTGVGVPCMAAIAYQ